jgi:hypothetical protein
LSYRRTSGTDEGGSLRLVQALRVGRGPKEAVLQQGVVRARWASLETFWPSGTKVNQKFPRSFVSTRFCDMLIVVPFTVLVGMGLPYSSCHRRSSLDG